MTQGYQDHPLLPASAPEGQAHILDGKATPVAGRKLADYIATFLLKLNKYPDALNDFFDPDVACFYLIRRYKEGQSNHKSEFMISREYDTVFVGFFTVHKNDIFCEAASITELSMDGPDAKWDTFWGARKACSSMPVESVCKTGFFNPDSPEFPCLSP